MENPITPACDNSQRSILGIPGDLVKIVGNPIDLERLQQDTLAIIAKYPFPDSRQICLTNCEHDAPAEARLYGGSGRLTDGDEFKFRTFNEEFKGTYFHEIYRRISEKYVVGRTRIALLKPRQCYSMHRDVSLYRYHVAIFTNPECFLVYEQFGIRHIPADGNIYRIHSRERHSAFNGGESDRYHLIIEIMSRPNC